MNPALLPPGTVVWDWRVVAWAGRGIHGAVYQVAPVDKEHAHPVALKLAMLPRDPRFAREAELLSCVRHPSIPRLWEQGEWQRPSGTRYPFVVMEWHVLRLLAQLASALQALHVQGCVHRDVKGDNVLVRHSDSRALLTGAARHASCLEHIGGIAFLPAGPRGHSHASGKRTWSELGPRSWKLEPT